jgi:hypothetical protein
MAVISLARLLRDQDRTPKAFDPPAPVRGWFTEGHHAADPREAGALLDEPPPPPA